MRILHTSDWHVGRTTYNKSRHADFVAVLDEIVEIARVQRPDLILHTGDLLDHSRVAHSDIKLTAACLQQLSTIAPVVIVAGNHDSTLLLEAFDLFHAGDRIHFITAPLGRHGDYLVFTGRDGTVLRLGALPFVNAARAIDIFDDPARWAGDYRHRVADIQQQIAEHLNRDLGPHTVTVFAAHLFITGAGLGGTERDAHVGADYGTHPDDIPQVDYAAFGHIHQAQRLPGRVVGCYAGSPIALDFGEVGQTKSITMIDLTAGQEANIEQIELHGGRALRAFSGALEQLERAADDIGDALCVVEIITETHDPALSQHVHAILRHATVLDISQKPRDGRIPSVIVPPGPAAATGDFIQQFTTYLADKDTSPAPAADVIGALAEFIHAFDEDREPSFPVEALLIADEGTRAAA